MTRSTLAIGYMIQEYEPFWFRAAWWFKLYPDGATSDRHNFSPLLLASIHGLAPAVKVLLKEGDGSLELRDRYGRTALGWAAALGYYDVAKLLIDGPGGMLKRLGRLSFWRGADIESRDDIGATPLIWATMGGAESIARLLVHKGADIEAKDGDGMTALLVASRSRGETAIAGFLLDMGANIEAKDDSGRTPLLRAVGSATVLLLLQKGANTEAKNDFGRTALMLAADTGRQDIAALLIENKAMLEAKDKLSRTALSIACFNGDLNMARFLLQKGADVDTKDGFAQSPLSSACNRRNEAVIKLLLESHADIELRCRHGLTPLSHVWQSERVSRNPYPSPTFYLKTVPTWREETVMAGRYFHNMLSWAIAARCGGFSITEPI